MTLTGDMGASPNQVAVAFELKIPRYLGTKCQKCGKRRHRRAAAQHSLLRRTISRSAP